MPSPVGELAEITELLRANNVAHALIGGWAVVSWGYLRGSDDLDLLIDLSSIDRRTLLAAMAGKWEAEWVTGGEDNPIPGLIKAEPKAGGLPIDLLPARGRADREAISRALTITLEGIPVPVVAPEDLIAMKLEAGGGQDDEDVRRLLDILSGKIDAARLRASCDERKVGDRLKLITRRQ